MDTKHYEIWKAIVNFLCDMNMPEGNPQPGYRSRIKDGKRIKVVHNLQPNPSPPSTGTMSREDAVVDLKPIESDMEDFKLPLIKVAPLFGEVFSHGDQPQIYKNYTTMGKMLEILHYSVLAQFPDSMPYVRPQRESDLIHDVKKALMKRVQSPKRKDGVSKNDCYIDGVRDIRLTDWYSSEVESFEVSTSRDKVTINIGNDHHLFFRFQVLHVYKRIGGTAN